MTDTRSALETFICLILATTFAILTFKFLNQRRDVSSAFETSQQNMSSELYMYHYIIKGLKARTASVRSIKHQAYNTDFKIFGTKHCYVKKGFVIATIKKTG